MFDGVTSRLPMRDPVPPRPAPFDVRAVLPLVCAQAAEAAVEALAHVVGGNALAVARWLNLNWGTNPDIRDPAHPAHVAALDESSPSWRLAEAQDALASACRRYQAATGQNGLATAHRIIETGYGAGVAAFALKPLDTAAAVSAKVAGWTRAENRELLPPLSSAEMRVAIDELLRLDDPEPPLEPTPEQWTAGRSAIAEWMLSDPDLDGLSGRLGALLGACKVAGGNPSHSDVTAALEAAGVAIGDALARGYEPKCMQAVLACWSTATGGPKITITVGS
jgi:hypothetical protein